MSSPIHTFARTDIGPGRHFVLWAAAKGVRAAVSIFTLCLLLLALFEIGLGNPVIEGLSLSDLNLSIAVFSIFLIVNVATERIERA